MRTLSKIISLLWLFPATLAYSHPPTFGEELCQSSKYQCLTIKKGDSWDSLFPNLETQDLVKRFNRMNVALKPKMKIAVPEHVENLTIFDISPFPRYLEPMKEKIIYVSQEKLAWAAYDEQGELLWWGPVSSGLGFCSESENGCYTPSGAFRVIRKQDASCISTVFPKRLDGEDGGAPMPYCMHFLGGYALHGSEELPGYRASHGCVRLFVEDARWLNEEFIDLPLHGLSGTRVIIGASGEF